MVFFPKNIFILLKNHFHIFIFAILYCFSLSLTPDFGLSWDEVAQREHGINTYNYSTGVDTQLLTSKDKYYGSVYEVALVSVEKLLSLQNHRTIYLSRHYLTHTFFFIACILFYYLSLSILKNKFFALVSFLFLFTYPRIFADSYYNTKDIPFLISYVIATATYFLVKRKVSKNSVALHAVTTALCIVTRLAGLFVFVITLSFFLTVIVIQKKEMLLAKKYIKLSLFYILVAAIFTYLLWPILWVNPFEFITAVETFKKFDWDNPVLFYGTFIHSSKIPLSYLPTWIGITVPISILSAFILGCGSVFVAVYKIVTKKDHNKIAALINSDILHIFIFLLIPVASVFLLKPVIYDGWRHFYFIYPLVCLISVYGLMKIFYTSIFMKAAVLILISVYFLEIIFFGVSNHPNEFVYFNRFAGKNLTEIKKNFEVDYWGVSGKQMLEKIITMKQGEIVVLTDSGALELNRELLQDSDKERVAIRDRKDDAHIDYFVGGFRWHPQEYDCGLPLYSVTVDGAALSSVYDFSQCTTLYINDY